jgi:hypothetical protein
VSKFVIPEVIFGVGSYKDFDSGLSKKFVLNPNGLIKV